MNGILIGVKLWNVFQILSASKLKIPLFLCINEINRDRSFYHKIQIPICAFIFLLSFFSGHHNQHSALHQHHFYIINGF